MKQIVLTAEQAQLVQQAGEPVEVVGPEGRTLAHLTPLTAVEQEAIERFKHGRPRRATVVPAEQVRAHLQRLEEIEAREALDEVRILELLRRMRAGENV